MGGKIMAAEVRVAGLRSTSTLMWMEARLAELSSSFTTRLFQGLQKTSGLWALGRKALATRAPSSIELSQNSCSREETSREAMVLGASPSTETNSMTKTLQRSMIRLVSYPWPTLARTQMALSSSSQLSSPPGLTESMWCSERW